MPSAVIKRFDYLPDSGELLIEFTSGRRYVYTGVAEEAAQRFRGAFAKGLYFNRYIRDRYPSREIEPSAG